MSRQVRWWAESATSTWQRVAAKPLRVTASTPQRDRLGSDRVDRRLSIVERHAGADQRAEQHVAAGAGGGVDPDRHAGRPGRGACRATRAANTPAPYPLSMLTTVTPGAQELSIAEQRGDAAERGAVADAGGHRDQRYAGQPADDGRQRALHAGDDDEAVGLRRAGRGRRAAGAARRRRRRVIRRPPAPCTRAVSAASAATGASEVPALTTATVPRAVGQRAERRGPGDPVDLGARRPPTACIASSESRVASTARSGWCSCSVLRIATTCSGVLPAPYTTSGSPVRAARSRSTRAKPRSLGRRGSWLTCRQNLSLEAVTRPAPGRVGRVDAEHLHVGGEERQLLERARTPGSSGWPSTSARNWVAVNSPPTM